jgi:hypothetical protein
MSPDVAVWVPPGGPSHGAWRDLDRLRDPADGLRIAFVSSTRAGLDPMGGLRHAVTVSERLGADLIVQLGDAIPGYAPAADLDAQWDALDAELADVRTPLLQVAGNHDVSDEAARRVWLARRGAPAYAVRVGSVLFLVLDTQDGAHLDADDFLADVIRRLDPELTRRAGAVLAGGFDGAALRELQRADPEAADALLRLLTSAKAERGGDGAIGDAQLAFVHDVLREAPEPSWTFVLMHQPAWAGGGIPGWDALRDVLGGRAHTMLSGHVIHGHPPDSRVPRAASLGYSDPDVADLRFGRALRRDLLTWARMTADGPVFTQLPLDEILDLGQQRLFSAPEWPSP